MKFRMSLAKVATPLVMALVVGASGLMSSVALSASMRGPKVALRCVVSGDACTMAKSGATPLCVQRFTLEQRGGRADQVGITIYGSRMTRNQSGSMVATPVRPVRAAGEIIVNDGKSLRAVMAATDLTQSPIEFTGSRTRDGYTATLAAYGERVGNANNAFKAPLPVANNSRLGGVTCTRM